MSDTVAPPLPDLFAAELQAERDQTFRLRAEAGQELALGRHSEDRSYRPDVDLGDLPNGRTVSRRHARLFRQDDEWFLRVEPDAANPTLVGGQRVDPGQAIGLTSGELLQFGAVSVAFQQYDPVQVVGPELIELTITPEPGGGRPRQRGPVDDHGRQLHRPRRPVRGRGPRPAGRVVHDAAERVEVARAEIPLFQTRARLAPASDAIARLQIHFKPPRLPSARAASTRSRFGSPAGPGRGCGARSPAASRSRRSRGWRSSRSRPRPGRSRPSFAWTVSNVGNSPTTIGMQTQALGTVGEGAAFLALPDPVTSDNPIEEDTRIAYRWEQPQFVLDAGRSQTARLRARVRKRHWWGGTVVHRFGAVAAAGTLSVADPASIASPPRVPAWVQAIVGWFVNRAAVLLPLLLLLVAFYVLFLQQPQVAVDICWIHVAPTGEQICQDLPIEGIPIGDKIRFTLVSQHATFVDIENSNFKGRRYSVWPAWIEQFVDNPPQESQFARSTIVWEESPGKTTTFLIRGKNAIGQEVLIDQTVLVHPAPRVEQFTTSLANVPREGEPVVVTFKATTPDDVDDPTVMLVAFGASDDRALDPATSRCDPAAAPQPPVLACRVGPARSSPGSSGRRRTSACWPGASTAPPRPSGSSGSTLRSSTRSAPTQRPRWPGARSGCSGPPGAPAA